MVFRLTSPIINKSQYNFWAIQNARLVIVTYRLKPAQKQLDNYLWKNFGLSLKAASLLVLANCKLQQNKSNELIITFPAKKIDQLASLITYGTGKLQGCSILKDAFERI